MNIENKKISFNFKLKNTRHKQNKAISLWLIDNNIQLTAFSLDFLKFIDFKIYWKELS